MRLRLSPNVISSDQKDMQNDTVVMGGVGFLAQASSRHESKWNIPGWGACLRCARARTFAYALQKREVERKM